MLPHYKGNQHQYWKQLYPNLNGTEHRTADQKAQTFNHLKDNSESHSNGKHWLMKLEIKAVNIRCYNLFSAVNRGHDGNDAYSNNYASSNNCVCNNNCNINVTNEHKDHSNNSYK